MTDTGEGDSVANPGPSNVRQSFALGKGALAGRIPLNSPPPGRLTSLRSRDLTLGGFKKVLNSTCLSAKRLKENYVILHGFLAHGFLV